MDVTCPMAMQVEVLWVSGYFKHCANGIHLTIEGTSAFLQFVELLGKHYYSL